VYTTERNCRPADKCVFVDHSADFRQLISLLQAGDPQAMAEAYRRFVPVLQVAVRRKLHPEMRSRFDTLDFVQDVWASFLNVPVESERFTSSEALIAFLCQIARNKVTDVARKRFTSEKDSANAEVHSKETELRRHSRTPTPSQWVMASEEFENILRQFPAGHQAIVRRLREGYSNEDIAEMSKVSLSTVNRVVKRLKELAGR